MIVLEDDKFKLFSNKKFHVDSRNVNILSEIK